ncbi:MAG: DMT family transporter [Pseudomonadota bacterium]
MDQPADGAARSDYYLGVTFVVVAAATYSTAGLFTKGVSAGAWEVIFWRGIFASAFTVLWTLARRSWTAEFARMGSSGWAVGIVGALGSAAFIPAFKLTTIANVSLIYAVAPLVAALLGWLAIGERASARTLVGSAVALGGIAIIVSGSLGEASLTGDLLALCMTVAMASIMVIYRKYPGTPGAGPSALQSLLLLPVAAVVSSPLQIERTEMMVLAAFGLLFAVSSVALAEGAKRIATGQTALLSALETPLALVFALLFFDEVPGSVVLLGGGLVLAAVLLSLLAPDRAAARRGAPLR